jgi:NAD-dependent dihydropyrimidine dehydrogenase PreA subunit
VEIHEKKWKTMTKNTYKGILRKKIPWYPTIDYSKCVSCGKCVDYCKLGVFSIDENQEKKRPITTSPFNCVVLCKGCQDICSSEAISHPSRKKTVELIRKLRKSQS